MTILCIPYTCVCYENRLVGLMVRCPPIERKILSSNPTWARIFSGSSHTIDLKIGTPVATLPGAWRYTYRVSTGTGWPGVSILWLGEVERLICNFYLSVAARKIVWADPSLRYTSLLLLSNQQTTTAMKRVSLQPFIQTAAWEMRHCQRQILQIIS